MGHHRNSSRRGQDQSKGEQADRPRVGAQLTERCEVRSGEQDRGQEEQEDDLGRELDPREAGHESQQQAANRHQDRVGDPDPPRQNRQQRDEEEQGEDRLDTVHAARLPVH